MADKSNIEWTDSTWNPIRGCTPISPGCKNCYASSVAKRFSAPGLAYEGLVRINAAGEATDDWNGTIKFVEKHLLDPVRWKKGRRIFVNSMSDLFHENVSDEWLNKIFAVMALCPQHTFQILTKRPERMLKYVKTNRRPVEIAVQEVYVHSRSSAKLYVPISFPLPNVMLGTSAENQKYYDERIGYIDELHAMRWKTFLSLEPLIGPIDVEYPKSLYPNGPEMCCNGHECGCRGLPMEPPIIFAADLVIVGGESGHGARPMQSRWAGAIQQSCAHWNIAYFHKQNGMFVDAGHEEFGKLPTGKIVYCDSTGRVLSDEEVRNSTEDSDVVTMKWVGRARAGKTLYGKTYHDFPEIHAPAL